MCGLPPQATNPRTGGHQPENWQVLRRLPVRGHWYCSPLRGVGGLTSSCSPLWPWSCSSSSFSPSFRPVSFSALVTVFCAVGLLVYSMVLAEKESRGRKYVCSAWITFDLGEYRRRKFMSSGDGINYTHWCYGEIYTRRHRTESLSLWSSGQCFVTWIFRQRCRHTVNMSCCQVADGLMSVARKNGLKMLPPATSAGIEMRAGGNTEVIVSEVGFFMSRRVS